MPEIESAAWLGGAKPVKMSEVENDVWLQKQEAAKLLKVSVRQLERRAQEGFIQKRHLPRRFNETSARVVYSRADIEKVLRGDDAELDLSEKALTWVSRAEAAKFLGISASQLDHRVRTGFIEKERNEKGVVFSMADLIALKAGKPIRVKKTPALPTPAPALAVVPPASKSPETIGGFEEFEYGVRVGAFLKARETPAPKPWLTLDEAVAASGLSRAYLLRRAREGWTAAVDQSFGGARSSWRFNREGLAR